MAQLAVTEAGALIGSYFGPVGAMVGSIAGTVLGGALLPQRTQGTQLWNLNPMYASYGTPIPLGFGTTRVTGTLIWATELIQGTTRDTGKGNLLGPEVYTYTCSFAVAFGRGVIADVLTIFADTKPIFNKVAGLGTGQTPQPYGYIGPQVPGLIGSYAGQTLVGAGIISNGAGGRADVVFRVYTGTATQGPDPAIAADPRVNGAGNVPGFRDLAYIVFENMSLADFGNRIPSISAVVSYATTPSYPRQGTTEIASPYTGVQPGVGNGTLAFDAARNNFYTATNAASDGKTYLIETDADTMTQTRIIPNEVMLADASNNSLGGGANIIADQNGYLYATIDAGSNSQTIVKIDLNTLQEVARVGVYSPLISPSFTTIADPALFGLLNSFGPDSTKVYLLTSAAVEGTQFEAIDTDSMTIAWYDGWTGTAVCTDAATLGFCPNTTSGATVIITNSAGLAAPIHIWQLTVIEGIETLTADGSPDPTNFQLQLQDTVAVATLAAAIASPTSGSWDTMIVGGFAFVDPADGNPVIFCVLHSSASNADQDLAFKWQVGSGLVWIAELVNQPPLFALAFDVSDGIYAWVLDGTIFSLALDTGVYSSSAWEDWTPNHNSDPQFYDGAAGAIVGYGTGSNDPAGITSAFCKLLLGGATSVPTTVGAIVLSLGEEVGFEEADFDVSVLTTDTMSVAGYLVQNPSSAADAIKPLMDVFFWDLIESDGVLKGVLRSNAPARTIKQGYLCAESGDQQTGEWFRERRVQDVDLPQTQTLTFIYPYNGLFESMTVMAQRMIAPLPSMHSSMKRGDAKNIVLDDNYAQNVAFQMLYEAWIQRSTYTFSTDWSNLDLDPNDVVTVTMDDGTTFTTRIMQAEVGANMQIEFTGVSTNLGVYTALPTLTQRPIATLPTPSSITAAKLFVFNLPLLRDQDDSGGAYSTVYYAAAAYGGAGGFGGCIVYQSPDQVTWTQVGVCASSVTWGTTATALPDAPGEFSWDTTTQLTAVFASVADAPASVSDNAVLTSYANAFAVSNSNGDWEVIQAANVVANADGSYTLSRLLRGRRGTDVFAVDHAIGDQIVYVEASPIGILKLGLSSLNDSLYYKAVPSGMLLEAAPTIVAKTTGRDMQPYAPEYVAATLDGSNDIVITWLRRTRLGGDLEDGTGTVPLAEASESYSIDVMTGPAGTVKRTLTATSPTVTYSNADVVADFGSVPAEITLHVYQISAVVGRGFYHEFTVAT